MKLGELGRVLDEMSTEHETETWKKKEYVAYRVTVTATATATPDNRVFGFSREIGGHDATCMTHLKRADGSTTTFCLHSGSHLTEAEACSLVRKGQGSVYKVTQIVERIK